MKRLLFALLAVKWIFIFLGAAVAALGTEEPLVWNTWILFPMASQNVLSYKLWNIWVFGVLSGLV